jgi:hypothetical protein
MNIRCDRCGREPDQVAPMLKDVVWRQIARKNETLCKTCADEAFRRRFGRELRFADLLPCAFNITWSSAFEELMPWDVSLPPGELERWQRAFATAERLIGDRKAMEDARAAKEARSPNPARPATSRRLRAMARHSAR